MINEETIREHLRRQRETGLNITDFCANEGIPRSCFYNWRKKFKKEKTANFIPLLVNKSPAPIKGQSKSLATGSCNQAIPGDDFHLELIYPNGTRLRIKNVHDLEHIRTLVTLLG